MECSVSTSGASRDFHGSAIQVSDDCRPLVATIVATPLGSESVHAPCSSVSATSCGGPHVGSACTKSVQLVAGTFVDVPGPETKRAT
jgi:hypothetical protein